MGIKHLQRFDVRGDHGKKAALLLALQLRRAKLTELCEYPVPKRRQKPEGDVVVAVLLKIPKSTPGHAAAHAKRRNRTVGKGDAFAEGLRDPHSAAKWHAHGAQEADASV